ncbi:anti-sigma factor [Pleionea sp. CnH1-48]|uniref:anti-sigma factor family protein n=1 Tax=Pleionea sp. CnH1-48 TaxID=2954494 RepID=UPI002096A18A|nr:zf-HC2 domain-containing protein [Pleionea sp. CnH1-48]MCO7227333.1 zf-HC2 domain-containing protein [Pleionea sp. CnH1-48]
MTEQCKQIETLLSGYIDGELTQQQSQKVHLHISSCDDCRKMLEELKQLKVNVGNMEKPAMPEEILDEIMQDAPARSMQTIGWFLLSVGCSFLVAFCGFHFFFSSDIPIFLKLIYSGIFGGLFFLFISVLRQRLIARKTDRYKGVDL